MVVWNIIVLLLIPLCMIASCDPTFQKPLDPFTLLRYDKRAAEDQPPSNDKNNVSVEFDEYPVHELNIVLYIHTNARDTPMHTYLNTYPCIKSNTIYSTSREFMTIGRL
jgi:hypothetical protein|uniref:Uncharacterized protein n=1 Tax=Sipha flava TaxID=143950 RepID=A0A2S2R8V1_9HEMI